MKKDLKMKVKIKDISIPNLEARPDNCQASSKLFIERIIASISYCGSRKYLNHYE